MDKQLKLLLRHTDPKVRETAGEIDALHKRQVRILSLVKEALGQLRLDFKYMKFDSECLRSELEEARKS